MTCISQFYKLEFSITTKIAALAFFLVLVTAFSVGLVFYTGSNSAHIRQTLKDMGQDVHLHVGQVQSKIQALRRDMLYIWPIS